jgi:hypothetical protein
MIRTTGSWHGKRREDVMTRTTTSDAKARTDRARASRDEWARREMQARDERERAACAAERARWQEELERREAEEWRLRRAEWERGE